LKFGVLAFQAVPESPKMQSTGQSAAPAPDAGATAPSAFGMFTPLLIVIPFILVLLFQSRSQQKKQEANITGLKKGDRVLTQSGLVGRLVAIEGRYAKLELPPSGTKITVLRTSLLGRDTETETSSSEASTDKDKADKAENAKSS
jgi:preprotein translocase subunit YajC